VEKVVRGEQYGVQIVDGRGTQSSAARDCRTIPAIRYGKP